jgi:hypothetical protein
VRQRPPSSLHPRTPGVFRVPPFSPRPRRPRSFSQQTPRTGARVALGRPSSQQPRERLRPPSTACATRAVPERTGLTTNFKSIAARRRPRAAAPPAAAPRTGGRAAHASQNTTRCSRREGGGRSAHYSEREEAAKRAVIRGFFLSRTCGAEARRTAPALRPRSRRERRRAPRKSRCATSARKRRRNRSASTPPELSTDVRLSEEHCRAFGPQDHGHGLPGVESAVFRKSGSINGQY